MLPRSYGSSTDAPVSKVRYSSTKRHTPHFYRSRCDDIHSFITDHHVLPHQIYPALCPPNRTASLYVMGAWAQAHDSPPQFSPDLTMSTFIFTFLVGLMIVHRNCVRGDLSIDSWDGFLGDNCRHHPSCTGWSASSCSMNLGNFGWIPAVCSTAHHWRVLPATHGRVYVSFPVCWSTDLCHGSPVVGRLAGGRGPNIGPFYGFLCRFPSSKANFMFMTLSALRIFFFFFASGPLVSEGPDRTIA